MKRTVKIALALASVALAGGIALAQHGAGGFGERRMAHHIDAALDAVDATDAQRTAIHAARDHVTATMQANAASRQADMQDALKLWNADRIDPAALAALRARHQAAAKKVGDAIIQAVSDSHDALTSAQRQKLATYLKSHRPAKMDGAKPWMKHMVSERVDDMLDQISATQPQRDTVNAAVQQALDAIAADDMAGHFAAAIDVFSSDKIDSAKVAALRADHEARAQKMGDAIADAITKVHDALTPTQRQKVAELVQAHHHGHGGHGG